MFKVGEKSKSVHADAGRRRSSDQSRRQWMSKRPADSGFDSILLCGGYPPPISVLRKVSGIINLCVLACKVL
jgi:hypothetical protein